MIVPNFRFDAARSDDWNADCSPQLRGKGEVDRRFMGSVRTRMQLGLAGFMIGSGGYCICPGGFAPARDRDRVFNRAAVIFANFARVEFNPYWEI